MEEITLEFILNSAIPQSPLGGKQTKIQRGNFLVSIVGGRNGLYGDFETTFEVTVYDMYGNFVTDKVIPSATGPVIGWVDKEHLLEMINTIPC